MVLPKLKLGSSKLNKFATIFDFFNKQAFPNKVSSFHKKDKLFPIDQVEGHITYESIYYNSISKQYRREVYYPFSLHFQECVFNRSVAFFNHSVNFGVIS